MEDPRVWISGDESASEMLARVPTERPFLLLPPLHRVPLRAGNIVEIAGPSSSAKTEVLMQAAINCILPREWNGIHFGGLDRMVMYFDLDCRFDVLRLAEALKLRIMGARGSTRPYWGSEKGSQTYSAMDAQISHFDDELFLVCMRRFLYIRCYNSLEFLAALKSMHCRAQMESEALGVGIHFLMIDSIGAFYWIDRACQPVQGDNKRRNLSLQNVVETIVCELRKLLQMQPVLVLATKASIFGAGISTNDAQRAFGRRSAEDPSQITDTKTSNKEKLLYHEYMPSVWQLFVTHRIHLRVSDGIIAEKECRTLPIYTSEWVQPPLNILDKFVVRDDGILMVS